MSEFTRGERKLLDDSRTYDPRRGRLGIFRVAWAMGLLAGALGIVSGFLASGGTDMTRVSLGISTSVLFTVMYFSIRERAIALSLVRKLAAGDAREDEPV